MAIVRMKRLHVIALGSARRRLMHDLSRLGCVEIESSLEKLAKPEWCSVLKRSEEIGDARQKFLALSSALSILSKYAPIKSGLFSPRREVSEREFESETSKEKALGIASKLNACSEKITSLYAEENRLTAKAATLKPWESMPVDLNYAGGKCFHVLFGTCPSVSDADAIMQDLAQAAPESELELISSDKEQHYFCLICHRDALEPSLDSLKKSGFSRVIFKDASGTASDMLHELRLRLDEISKERAALEGEIAEFAPQRPLIEQVYDLLNLEAQRDEMLSRLGTTKTTVFMEGWVPRDAEADVSKVLEASECAYVFSDPSDDEEPPVVLANGPAVTPFGTITELYSLPGYNTVIDPNPFVAVFFFLFFGMMLSDAAYGLILALGALFVLKKARPSGTFKKFMQVAAAVGFSAFLWGAVFGSWFGDAVPAISMLLTGKRVTVPFLIDPLADPIVVLMLALGLGVVHLFVGMGLSGWRMIKQGHPLDALFDVGFWYLIIGGLIATLTGLSGGIYVAAAGALGVFLTAGRAKKSIFGKITGGLGALYGVTSYLSDILSYSRLMALGLSTGVVASVINTMGSLGGSTPVGWILFIFVFILGHTFNIAVNLLGAFVHTCRLHYVEFFGKFFEGAGRPFVPLFNKTKYVAVIKEEN